MTYEQAAKAEYTEEDIERILEEDDRYFIQEGADAGVYD